MSPIFMHHIQGTLLMNFSNRYSFVYGTVTLYCMPFQATSTINTTVVRKANHISTCFHIRIQFALGRVQSLLLTASLLISFPAGTETFHFPAFPII